jgi:Tetratricopeptide repeat
MSTPAHDRLEQVAQALERQDYRSATELLKGLWQEMPENPWVQVYRGRLYEAAGKLDQAESVYRQLMREVTNPKVALQARQGLQRIEDLGKQQKADAIAQVTQADPHNQEPGLLVLEAILPETRPAAAAHLAQVMSTDPYTARMQIPNRGWRIYRQGPLGELQFYGQQLQSGGIPAFWVALENLQSLPVFQVKHFTAATPTAAVICQNADGQLGELKFNWSEVAQRVEGGLPLFEQVVDTDMRQGTGRQRKSETQDYARICDLHLPGRNCILRLCDHGYQFHEGLEFTDASELDQLNTRIHWNHLMELLKRQLPNGVVWKDFAPFAEAAIAMPILLEHIPSQINLFGQEDGPWNSAFQLYSGLAYCRSGSNQG